MYFLLQELRNLLEDAKSDISMGNYTLDYFNRVISYLGTTKTEQTIKKLKPDVITIDFTDLDKKFPTNLKIVLYDVNSSENISSIGGDYNRKTNKINIYNLKFNYDKGTIDNIKDKRNVFQHELAHYLDQQKYKDQQYLDKQSKININQFGGKDLDYFNSVWEQLAYYQGYMTDLINLSMQLRIPFNKFMEVVKKDKKVSNAYDNFSEENKKRFIKKVYRIYDYVGNNKELFEFMDLLNNISSGDVGMVIGYIYNNLIFTEDSLNIFKKKVIDKMLSDNSDDSDFVKYAKDNIDKIINFKKILKKEMKTSIGDYYLVNAQKLLEYISSIINKYQTGKEKISPDDLSDSISRYSGNVSDVISKLSSTEKNILVYLLNTSPDDLLDLMSSLEKYDLSDQYREEIDIMADSLGMDKVLVLRELNFGNSGTKYILTDFGKKVAKKLKSSNNYSSFS